MIILINLSIALLHTGALEISALLFRAARRLDRPEALISYLLIIIATVGIAAWAGHLYHKKIKNAMVAAVYLFAAAVFCQIFIS
jgi:hypothetical protein